MKTIKQLQIVLDGKCTPTVKFDGSCCAVIDGKCYKRYDAKAGKKAPEGAIPCQDNPDPVTGHWPHWIQLCITNPDDKWHIKAFENYIHNLIETTRVQNVVLKSGDMYQPVTYEAIGPHFQSNPYKLTDDTVVMHGKSIINELVNKKLTIDILRDYLQNHNIEGIVFWLTDPTGDYPICKIKRSDFAFEWPIKEK